MRLASLLLGLTLAGCAGSAQLTGEQPAPAPAAVVAEPAPPPSTAPPPPRPSSPRGPAQAATPAPPPPPPPTIPREQLLMEARTLCWMKVEQQRANRDIDRRIAFVDKCVADEMKLHGEDGRGRPGRP